MSVQICIINNWNQYTKSNQTVVSYPQYALCLKKLHKQSTYTVGYISVLQTLNNNKSIGRKVFKPDIDSDVAAATIKTNN